MTNQNATQEPTMEEILASIRRIISEDSGSKDDAEVNAAPPPVAEPEPAPEPEPVPEPEPLPEPVSLAEPDIEFHDELENYQEAAIDSGDKPDEYAPEPGPEPVAMEPAEAEVESDDIVFSEDDVLELTEPLEMEPEPEVEPKPKPELEPEIESAPVYVPEQPEPAVFETAHQPVEPEDDIAFEESAMTTPASDQTQNSSSLLSSDAEKAASAAFGALASSMLTSPDGRTLEDIVSDMLRPMLKEWLDQNLPSVVEDLVREEIARVARRTR